MLQFTVVLQPIACCNFHGFVNNNIDEKPLISQRFIDISVTVQTAKVFFCISAVLQSRPCEDHRLS